MTGEALFVVCFKNWTESMIPELIFWLTCKQFPLNPETITVFKRFIPLRKSGLKFSISGFTMANMANPSIHLVRFLIHARLYRQRNFFAVSNKFSSLLSVLFLLLLSVFFVRRVCVCVCVCVCVGGGGWKPCEILGFECCFHSLISVAWNSEYPRVLI